MAGSRTYSKQVIVLRKTKLGESDLILTLLAADGSQLRAVAKGARKPSNTFSSRLELYSVAEVLCSVGRNLDIIKEARLIAGHAGLRNDIERSMGAAPMVELLDRVVQQGLVGPKLFDMTHAAFDSLERVPIQKAPSITAAHLLKAFAFSGIKPSFTVCAACGEEVNIENEASTLHLSYREGGMLCNQCGAVEETILVQSALVQWARFLLGSTFADIEVEEIPAQAAFEVLQFCQQWTREHVNANLKSLAFMLTSGLYE